MADETTICNFRHLLDRHDLGQRLFETVHEHLERRGIEVARGTIVDAAIINATSSTKNATGTHDPDMCQTRKGIQWNFGMTTHIGVDSAAKVIHSVVATAATGGDCTTLPDLLHYTEMRVYTPRSASCCCSLSNPRSLRSGEPAPYRRDIVGPQRRFLPAQAPSRRRDGPSTGIYSGRWPGVA